MRRSANKGKLLLSLLAGVLLLLLPLRLVGEGEIYPQIPTPKPSQEPPPKPVDPAKDDLVIRVNASLTMVPVSITDSAGQPVRNLRLEDFVIEEDGKPQEIAKMAEPGESPVELVLLFDISGSVHGRFEFEQQAATRFLKQVLKPHDSVSVFAIGPEAKMIMNRTTGTQLAFETLRRLESTREATAFFDTVVEATRYLRQNAAPASRRVEVVLSDGEDNFSYRYQLKDALRELQQADCLFYSINPSGPSIRLNKISLRGQDGMEKLALQTGGFAFVPDKIEELDAIFGRISAEIQAQYLLGYYSSNQKLDGKFRQIEVRVPKRPDLRIRARQGYYASRIS